MGKLQTKLMIRHLQVNHPVLEHQPTSQNRTGHNYKCSTSPVFSLGFQDRSTDTGESSDSSHSTVDYSKQGSGVRGRGIGQNKQPKNVHFWEPIQRSFQRDRVD